MTTTQMKMKKSNFDVKAFLEEANKYDKYICESLGLSFGPAGVQCACPVHDGDNPMGFSYCSSRKVWSCWTHRCHEKYTNNLIGLVRSINKCSFKEAIDYISKVMKNPNVIPSDTKEVMEYREIIYPDSVLDGLNFAPQEWLDLGFSREILGRFKVFKCERRGVPMYGRIVVPFIDHLGRIVGFTGYKTGDIVSDIKWKNSKGFRKSRYVFGLYFVPKEATSVYLVEGPKDFIRMHEAGYTNSVALFGNSICNDQVKLLKDRGITTINILLDPDSVGIDCSARIEKRLKILFDKVNILKTSKDPGKLTVDELRKELSIYE